MSFVIDKQGNYLPVFGEATGGGGGGGGTTDHAELSHLDYASSGHTGFMSSANYIPKGTTIDVKTDGSGDYTTIPSALASLVGKWSDGSVTIQLGNGTFDVSSTQQISNTNFNIPKLIIKGSGISNTTINWATTTDHADLFRVSGQKFEIKDCTIQHLNGTTSTDYRGIMSIDNAFTFCDNCAFVGINYALWGFRAGDSAFASCSFSDCATPVVAEGGNIYIAWATTGTFTNITTALSVSGGGIIKGGYNSFTFTNVTNKVSQTPGTTNVNGWIAVSNSGLT